MEQPRVIRIFGPAIVLMATIVMLAWTWQRCPNPIIDFGREIYLPWRITEGDVLYRDLNSFNGPFSPYFNAAMFKVAGVSLRTLKISNALVTIAVALLIYWLIREMSDRLTATVCGVAFATIFACGHIIGAANFNFLTPYSHELTHGIFLSLVMFLCLQKSPRGRTVLWMAGAGLALGLVLLTKAEIALASAAGAGTWLTMQLIGKRTSAREALIFIAAALAAPLVAITLLSTAMPIRQAVAGSAGAWVWVGDSRIRALPFFRWVLGTDQLQRNVEKMLLWLARYALVFVPAVIAGIVLPGRMSRRQVGGLTILSTVVVVAPLTVWWGSIPWEGVTRPLPLLLLIVAVIVGTRWLKAPSPRAALILSMTVFSLALLLKILLNVHPFHYGFVLSMPGTMLLIAALVCWVPGWVQRMKGNAWLPRAVALSALGVVIGGHLYTTGRWLAVRNTPVGAGADAFLADSRGELINQALERLGRELRPGDTLAAMPEGNLLNYLLRAPSSVRWQNFLPSEMMMYGEQTMLTALSRQPPTFVALVHRDASEYEAPSFGEDYARLVAGWLRQNYVELQLLGAPPFLTGDFGILLLRHRPQATSLPITR